MGQTKIEIKVDTVKLLQGISTHECCTISQTGDGIFLPNPNPELAISEVYKTDAIIWSGIADDGVTIINITDSCDLTNYFGTSLPGYPPGQGSTVTRVADHLMHQPLPYTISFKISGHDTPHKLDPKIKIIQQTNTSSGA